MALPMISEKLYFFFFFTDSCLLSFQIFRYFTDILNMLQGFYVFLIFVCKRNVYQEIVKKTGRYNLVSSDAGRAMKKMSDSGTGGASSTQITTMQSRPIA